MLSGFTLLAGGENPRGELHERIVQRYFHKFRYTKVNDGFYSCVGCGRCKTVCLFQDDMGKTIHEIVAAKKVVGQEPVLQASETRYELQHQVPNFKPDLATIKAVTPVTETDAEFTLGLEVPMDYKTGQFVQIGVLGLGEVPISISSSIEVTGPKELRLVIRTVGRVTSAIHKMSVGDQLTIRGPFGTAWPIEEGYGKEVLLFAGGIGLCPLRGAVNEFIRQKSRFKSVRLYYGAQRPSLINFRDEIEDWKNEIKVLMTVDRVDPDESWTGDVGIITNLFENYAEDFKPSPEALVLVCGPPIMIHFVCKKLEALGYSDQQIYVSLERRMHCGMGSCGHCNIGHLYVCRDGPVFRLDQVKEIQGAVYLF
jgi:NAD(P)H-flavin reductase